MKDKNKLAQELYNMECGDRYYPDNNTAWFRVPGGWTYSNSQGVCFVPFSDEFWREAYREKK